MHIYVCIYSMRRVGSMSTPYSLHLNEILKEGNKNNKRQLNLHAYILYNMYMYDTSKRLHYCYQV